jgi:hypothetical protein
LLFNLKTAFEDTGGFSSAEDCLLLKKDKIIVVIEKLNSLFEILKETGLSTEFLSNLNSNTK